MRRLAIAVIALATGVAQAALLTGSFAPTSTTSGTQSWNSPAAANGVAGSNVTVYSGKSFNITDAISGNAVNDWVILDNSGDLIYTRKSGGSAIGAITFVNNTTDYPSYTEATVTNRQEANADRLTWTGGDAVADGTAVAGLNSKRYYNGSASNTGIEGNGWTFTLPASATTNYVRIYAGSYEAWGRLTATLGDGSAGPLTAGWGIDNNNYGTNWMADIAFQANGPTTLTITMIMDGGNPTTADGDKGNYDGLWLSGIATTIPEPASAGLLLGAAAMIGLRHRIRRR